MSMSLLDKFMLITFNLLINNVVESNRDIVMHSNIVCHSCARDNKIEEQEHNLLTTSYHSSILERSRRLLSNVLIYIFFPLKLDILINLEIKSIT